jgi:hypothetical protein
MALARPMDASVHDPLRLLAALDPLTGVHNYLCRASGAATSARPAKMLCKGPIPAS